MGIIRIHQEERPVYLEADYGKLRRREVYVRRGSATDPQTPASPDEIARMSPQQEAAGSPRLVVVFTNVDRDEVVGAALSVQGENCSMPATEDIPKLSSKKKGYASWDDFTHTNSDYYVRLAEYTRFQRMAFRSRVALMNEGSVEARKVLVEFAVPKGGAIELHQWAPRAPRRTDSTLGLLGRSGGVEAVDTRTYAGDLYIDEDDDGYRMQINFLDIQPGRRIRSDDFYVSVRTSGIHKLEGWVYAANLPKAEAVQLSVEADIGITSMTVDQLVALAMRPV